MNLTVKLAISYYKTIAVINEAHKVFLVQHQETNKIYIKKLLDVYNLAVYQNLQNNPVIGTPAIIELYEEDNRLTVIEEYISGNSLTDKITNSVLSEKDFISYALDLCDIINQLHSKNPAIIHRDIKPSNIIITSYNRAVLLDFNAAKFHSAAEAEDTVLLGTKGYAAPEQYGFGSSSQQTDIYSFGIMLKEMLSVVNDASDFFLKYMNTIIDKCTQLNPSDRYIDITEVKTDFLIFINPKQRKPLFKALKQYTLPGFRTKTPWKMLVAYSFYLVLAIIVFTAFITPNFDGSRLNSAIIAMYVLLTLFSTVACWTNYLNIQNLLPLCRHKNIFAHYLGVIILNSIILFILLATLYLIEITFFM